MWELLKNDRCDDVRWVIQAIVVFDPSHGKQTKNKKAANKKSKSKSHTQTPSPPVPKKAGGSGQREKACFFIFSFFPFSFFSFQSSMGI